MKHRSVVCWVLFLCLAFGGAAARDWDTDYEWNDSGGWYDEEEEWLDVPYPRGFTAEDFVGVGLPLKVPDLLYPDRKGVLEIDLTYTTCDYFGPYSSFRTRCYGLAGEDGGYLVPPTWVVKPGDTIKVTLTNLLSDQDDVKYHNYWQKLNHTNLHTHGLHISGEEGADDVLTEIEPASLVDGEWRYQSLKYTYDILDYHSPGTAWYHPHVHGNAALQTGHFAAGIIIIDDEDDSFNLPSYIDDLQEIHLLVSHMQLEEVWEYGMQDCANSALMQIANEGPEGSRLESIGPQGLLLVNGMTTPVINIVAGQYYRVRTVMASALYAFNGILVGDNSGSCEARLLAKDSIYLFDPLRNVTRIVLWPGMRADIVFKCDDPGLVEVQSRNFTQPDALTRHVVSYLGPGWFFNVTEAPASEEDRRDEGPLPAFTQQRPCYLVDTREIVGDEDRVVKKDIIFDECTGVAPAEDEKIGDAVPHTYDVYPGTSPISEANNMTCGGIADNFFQAKNGLYCLNGCPYETGHRQRVFTPKFLEGGVLNVNSTDVFFEDEFGTACLTINDDQHLPGASLIEWNTYGADFHPVHFHVNPYQVVAANFSEGSQFEQFSIFYGRTQEEFEELTGNFVNIGDYGDVVLKPLSWLTLHQQTDMFAGKMIVHCHILLHEDWGMIGAYDVQGDDGQHWPGAKELDPTCYWSQDEKQQQGYTLIDTCADNDDCPKGWRCRYDRQQKDYFCKERKTKDNNTTEKEDQDEQEGSTCVEDADCPSGTKCRYDWGERDYVCKDSRY